MRAIVIGAVALFLAGCATVSGPDLPPVRDGPPPGAAASPRSGSVPVRPDPAPAGAAAAAVPVRAARGAPVPERRQASSDAAGSRPAEVSPAPPDAGRSGTVPLPRSPASPPGSDAGLPREGNSAVVALLESAREAGEARQYGRAAAALERALKVEPRNPWLWHRLAAIRYRQNRHAEAETLALRSMSFGRADRELDSRNWRIIAAARRGRGDEAGAREALQRAGAP